MSDNCFAEEKIVGRSPTIKKNWEFIKKAARSDKNILIMGETGTGKDLTAKNVHDFSSRRERPYVAINCANIPEELFEAELFGYVRGSFTGAVKEKEGLLETAKDGTVFLDEIGDLTPYLQAKILRVIDKRELRRIGETKTRKIHARFIFATNKDLQEEVKSGRFRKDLYFRISVLKFFISPLRERKEDIPLVVNHILERENRKGETKKGISLCALKKLMAYHFPGNVRELENILERAYILSEGDQITEKDIKFDYVLSTYKQSSEMTAEQLRQILEDCRWNKTKAASEIGKSRRQFYRLLEKYQMSDCIRKNYFFL